MYVVNVSGRNRRKILIQLEQAQDSDQTEDKVPVDLFDDTLIEIWCLMVHDSYPRFRAQISDRQFASIVQSLALEAFPEPTTPEECDQHTHNVACSPLVLASPSSTSKYAAFRAAVSTSFRVKHLGAGVEPCLVSV